MLVQVEQLVFAFTKYFREKSDSSTFKIPLKDLSLSNPPSLPQHTHITLVFTHRRCLGVPARPLSAGTCGTQGCSLLAAGQRLLPRKQRCRLRVVSYASGAQLMVLQNVRLTIKAELKLA